MPKILVTDPMVPEGIELLRVHAEVDVKTDLSSDQLIDILGDYDVLLVRSETKVTAEIINAGRSLKVIGRAGVGIDNIDVDAATSSGIAVVNAASGNTVAAAEHTIALMLALARNIPAACESMKSGLWERANFVGVELRNKTLGCIGLGKVGCEVLQRVQGFGMQVIAYDPFVAPELGRSLGVELLSLDDLLSRADFITMHVPLTEKTRDFIGTREFSLMKPGVFIINAARGGIINEDDLLKALNDGLVQGAALDVFSEEPTRHTDLVNNSRVISTPHLGASTEEAQREVVNEVAGQVLAVLAGRPARNTVNAPFIQPEGWVAIEPYIQVATTIGKLLTQLGDGQFVGINVAYQGDVANYDTSTLTAASLMGLLGNVSDEKVNLINSSVIATKQGLSVTEQRDTVSKNYEGSIINVTLTTSIGEFIIAGTLMRGETHIVRVNEYWLDMIPTVPYLLFIEHQDRPGMIGALGNTIGRHGINISFMDVGRLSPKGQAMMVVGLDDPIETSVLEELKSIEHIKKVILARL